MEMTLNTCRGQTYTESGSFLTRGEQGLGDVRAFSYLACRQALKRGQLRAVQNQNVETGWRRNFTSLLIFTQQRAS